MISIDAKYRFIYDIVILVTSTADLCHFFPGMPGPRTRSDDGDVVSDLKQGHHLHYRPVVAVGQPELVHFSQREISGL